MVANTLMDANKV